MRNVRDTIWVNWETRNIALSCREAMEMSIADRDISDFDDWLEYSVGMTYTEVFNLTEAEKAKLNADYKEYVRQEMDDLWEEIVLC